MCIHVLAHIFADRHGKNQGASKRNQMKMRPTSTVAIVIAIVMSCIHFSSFNFRSASREDPVNIFMITCHDIGQHLGAYGIEEVQTPHIDGLAREGILFKNFYSTSAVCSPGRGSLHTGRYPQSNGLMGLTHGPWWWQLNDEEQLKSNNE
jgi:hypothetical protein